jgi:hypothetical protein
MDKDYQHLVAVNRVDYLVEHATMILRGERGSDYFPDDQAVASLVSSMVTLMALERQEKFLSEINAASKLPVV